MQLPGVTNRSQNRAKQVSEASRFALRNQAKRDASLTFCRVNPTSASFFSNLHALSPWGLLNSCNSSFHWPELVRRNIAPSIVA
jgi:hypothetical protein